MSARSTDRRRSRLAGAAGAAIVVLLVVGLSAAAIIQRTEVRESLEVRFPRSGQTPQPPAALPEPTAPEVEDEQRLSPRTVRYRLSSELVPAGQTQDGPSAVVTLPADYDPSHQYPVIYLLTGTDGGSAPRDWHDLAALEDALGDLDAIAVALDDGAYGWYTD